MEPESAITEQLSLRKTVLSSENSYTELLRLLKAIFPCENGVTVKTVPRFYLESVDIYQGITVLYIVAFHTLLWWDESIDSNWLLTSPPVLLLMTTAQFIPPGLYFLYAINTANSLLQKSSSEKRRDARTQLLKRTVLFFILGVLSEAVAGLATDPSRFINYLVTWELFHTFAASTLAILLVFELAWYLEPRIESVRSTILAVLIACWTAIMAIFFLFHVPETLAAPTYSVDLTLPSIASRAVFERGQAPLIPWLSFTLTGGITAAYLHAPLDPINAVKPRMAVLSLVGIILTFAGLLLLTREIFISPPLLYSASTSLVVLSQGCNILLFLCLFTAFDLPRGLYSGNSHRWLMPVLQASQIMFTVYVVHNVLYVIPSELFFQIFPAVSETLVLGFGLCYGLVFYGLAQPWSKREFKYSLEWWLNRLQKASWKWFL